LHPFASVHSYLPSFSSPVFVTPGQEVVSIKLLKILDESSLKGTLNTVTSLSYLLGIDMFFH